MLYENMFVLGLAKRCNL